MRIWLESEGMVGTKKPKFFAVVEEEMIDKNGRTVAAAAKEVEQSESAVVEPTKQEVAATDSNVNVQTVVNVVGNAPDNNDRLSEIERKVVEVNEKVDMIIEGLRNNTFVQVQEKVVEETTEEVVEETTEEVVEEATEEVVEETTEEVVEEATEEVVEETTVEPTESIEVEVTNVEEEVAVTAVAVDMVDGAEVAPDVEKKGYVRSPTFAEKMMRADELIQDRYDELKNYALRFRKLKARISKKFDSINQGRFHFVKLSVAGKTLKLYLNMDITTVDPKYRCVDVSGKKTYVTVPVLLRIKSGRAMKYAKRLIDQCAEQNGMLERRKPLDYIDSIALIEEALNNKDEADLLENEDFIEVNEGSEE